MAKKSSKVPGKAKVASFSPMGPGGSPGPATAPSMAQPKAPGGGGFLINHNAFTDARPPQSRGMKKSAGYPSFQQNP